MTRCMMLALVAWAAVAPAFAQDPAPAGPKATASIVGRVVAADTGRAIRGAVVAALSWDVMRVPKTAGTDEQGRFEFTELLPGRYELSLNVTGYVPYETSGNRVGNALPPIDLGEGARFDKANIALHRPGAIEGRLRDEFGDPAPNVLVQVTRFEYAAGRKRLMPVSSRTAPRPTDDKGHFRVFGLTPGSYYVTALGGAFVEGGGPAGFAPTYFPGTSEIGEAMPIDVKIGETTPEVAFQLAAVRTANVGGILVGGDGQPVPQGTLMLMIRDSLRSAAFTMARAISSRDGSFLFRNVPPGTYTVQAWGRSIGGGGNLNASEFGSLPVAVTGPDVLGVVVNVARGASARGRVVFEEGSATQPKPGQVRVAGGPVEFDAAPVAGGPTPTEMHDDWTFALHNLTGSWVIRADVQSADWTLKRITLEGKDVTDTPIEFKGKDVDGLEVTLTSRNASIAGAVADASGRPAGRYSVIVFAADPSRWAFPSRFLAVGRPNQDGRFKVTGLPPENYLVLAVPALQGSEWQDPDLLETLRPFAQAITLSEGEARTLDLKLRK